MIWLIMRLYVLCLCAEQLWLSVVAAPKRHGSSNVHRMACGLEIHIFFFRNRLLLSMWPSSPTRGVSRIRWSLFTMVRCCGVFRIQILHRHPSSRARRRKIAWYTGVQFNEFFGRVKRAQISHQRLAVHEKTADSYSTTTPSLRRLLSQLIVFST